MTNDAEAREAHATVTSSGRSQEPADGDQAQRPDVLDGEAVADAEIIDPDAVIIEEVPAGPADEPARTGTTAGTGTPANSGATPAGSNGPADTNMAGDPEQLHEQWAAIQSTFVDDPRGSVAAAAEFVTETTAALVASAQERERALRGEWDRDGVDTEGLRTALRSYRVLLDRLVRM
jgi:hypothetical protein